MEYKTLYDEYLMKTYAFKNLTLVNGNGCYLYDTQDNKYLDFTSGIGVNSLGYSHKDQNEAIKAQIDKVCHLSNMFYNDVTGKVAKKLIKATDGERVFFTNSGAESIECAIKIARKYSFDKYGIGRGTIVSLKNSFHGRTIAALTATGQEKFHNYFHPFPKGFKYVYENNIMDLKEKIDSTVCALIMEPVLGEGGVIPLEHNFVKEAIKICKEHDILVIFDEVQTGASRTGYFLAQKYFNVKGDITTLAKGIGGGLPVGAVVAGRKVSNVLKIGEHGSTYGGNPLVMSSVNVILDYVTQENFCEEIREKGLYLMEEIKKFKSSIIKCVRGKGLMIGIELININVNNVSDKLLKKGLLTVSSGRNTLRLLPPLIINKDEIDEGISILKKVLED